MLSNGKKDKVGPFNFCRLCTQESIRCEGGRSSILTYEVLLKDLPSRSLLQILNGDTDFDILQRTCAKSSEESVSDPNPKWQVAAMLKFPSLSQVRVTRSLTIPI